MGLLDDINAQVRHTGAQTCKVHDIAATLEPEDAADLLAALAGSVSVSAIQRALHGRGVRVSCSALARFRAAGCICAARR